jgi:sugar transferase (PEP-CTERM/EpsH1 system associated)
MQILFLTHRIPFPPNKGDKIRSYHILEYLAAHHDVYVGTLIDDKNDLRFVPAVQARVRALVYRRIRTRLRKLAAFMSVFRSKPISTSYFYSRGLQRDVDDLIDHHELDVVLCSSSPMAEYVLRSNHWGTKLNGTLLVMDLIDVDSHKWRQYARRASDWRRWVYRYEAEHLAAYEKTIAGRFHHVLVVSDQEKQIFEEHVLASSNVTVMSNGVDLHYFSPTHVRPPSDASATIVFTGVMDYWPNIEGVAWLAEKIFPRIRKVVPKAVFYVVGSKPTSEVEKLARLPGVRVTGFVDDVRDYLSAADVCVVPLRIARGIQNKVLEAMAMGRPVVSTPQALEGIRAVPGQDLIAADDETSFAESVIELLENRAGAEAMGARARACVERFYSWEGALKIMDEIFGQRTDPSRS